MVSVISVVQLLFASQEDANGRCGSYISVIYGFAHGCGGMSHFFARHGHNVLADSPQTLDSIAQKIYFHEILSLTHRPIFI